MMLNEALTLKALLVWKKLLKIKDKTVIYQPPDCVLSKVLIISPIEKTQKMFGFSLEKRKIDQE